MGLLPGIAFPSVNHYPLGKDNHSKIQAGGMKKGGHCAALVLFEGRSEDRPAFSQRQPIPSRKLLLSVPSPNNGKVVLRPHQQLRTSSRVRGEIAKQPLVCPEAGLTVMV